MQPVLLIDVVGLTTRLLSDATPHLRSLAARAPMTTVLPAVTCSAQATMLTGLPPSGHGAVGNGWYARDSGEVALWRQSNALVSGAKLYELVKQRDPRARVAKLFWWWNLGAAVDLSITPRPFYPADGRKIPATYSWPACYGERLAAALGPFPFFDFWGPKSGLPSSRWIADATLWTLREERPALTLAYLPHLDYDFQRCGPDDARARRAVAEIDGVVGDLLRAAAATGTRVVVVSEYGIDAVERPVHVNRALRDAGLLVARPTPAGDVLDVFGSRAFALADHQVAHVYCRGAGALDAAREVLASLPGVERVLAGAELERAGLLHARSGDLVLVAERGAWFTYYYWSDPAGEPDFARTVDIHRKPGYDPCELFVDPRLALPALRVARRLVQKKLGFRYLMDVIPLDASLVRGSHGRLPDDPADGPVFLASEPFARCGGEPADGVVAMESVPERVLALMGLAR
ncbi:MAG: alkaline phosphatase family protein [Planctomycetes bacterium]|nr:alkaline phosphatase family protein [Planctomycetota bacterium]